jgi:hypothetical protein
MAAALDTMRPGQSSPTLSAGDDARRAGPVWRGRAQGAAAHARLAAETLIQ